MPETYPPAVEWTTQLADQLDWHWNAQLRPRIEGLTDEEYLWEPVEGCWSIRPRGEARAGLAAGRGDVVLEADYPDPDPAPVTTIAWRLAHLIVGVFGVRAAAHFGGPPVDLLTFDYAPTADVALRQLDEAYAAWMAGVRRLRGAELARPSGRAEGAFGRFPMAALVLHIHREAIHHGAEIALLRDLFARRASQT